MGGWLSSRPPHEAGGLPAGAGMLSVRRVPDHVFLRCAAGAARFSVPGTGILRIAEFFNEFFNFRRERILDVFKSAV